MLSPLTFSILAVVLAAGLFAVYSPSLDYQFILDDHRFVNDPRLQSSGHVWEYFSNYVWAQFPGGASTFYRPLFVLWLRVNFMLSEMSSWRWHLLSVVKHLGVAVLLGLLVWKLLRDRVAVLIAGMLFALHPAQTESVAWVTVPDPLMSAAVLGAVLLYLRYAGYFLRDSQPPAGKSGTKSRKLRQDNSIRANSVARSSATWLIGSALLCLVALLAKETAIVLPAIIFALALLPPSPESGAAASARDEDRGLQPRLLDALLQIVPFLCVTLAYLLLRLHALGGRMGALTQHLPLKTLLLSWPATLWFYVKVLLWPVRLRAFADSSQADAFSPRGVLLPAVAVCAAAATLGGSLAWAWRKARRDLQPRDAAGVHCAMLLGTLLLVLPILPALSLNALNPGDFLHGRYTYLSSTGLMLLLATGWHLTKRARIPLLCGAGLLAVIFSVLTVTQEAAWKDDLTVFTVAQQIAPHNAPVAQSLARAHVQVALDLDVAGHCNEAMPVFEQVTQQYPEDWYAWAGLGDCLLQINDLSGAERALRRAADLSHEPRVTDQWQKVRARLEGGASVPAR